MPPETLSEKIVTSVAETEGIDAADLHDPLYTAVNPDALEALFARPASENGVKHVTFQYHGYEITIDADRTISIASVEE